MRRSVKSMASASRLPLANLEQPGDRRLTSIDFRLRCPGHMPGHQRRAPEARLGWDHGQALVGTGEGSGTTGERTGAEEPSRRDMNNDECEPFTVEKTKSLSARLCPPRGGLSRHGQVRRVASFRLSCNRTHELVSTAHKDKCVNRQAPPAPANRRLALLPRRGDPVSHS